MQYSSWVAFALLGSPGQLDTLAARTQEFLHEPNFDAVRRVRLHDIHAAVVRFAPGPVLLEFEEKLQRGDRHRACLNQPRYRPFVSLGADVAAGVGGDVDLVAGLEKVKRRKEHAGFGPETGQDDFFLPGFFDRSPEVPVEPGVD